MHHGCLSRNSFLGLQSRLPTTSDGVFVIDMPQQPINAAGASEEWSAGQLVTWSTPSRIRDHIRGNAHFPGAEVIGHE